MTVQSHSLHRSHEALLRAAERLAETARELRHAPPHTREQRLSETLRVLHENVLPHIEHDQREIYPEVAKRFRDEPAAAFLNDDHLAIGTWIDRLAAASLNDAAAIEEILYGLNALITVHVWKEERLYSSVLEAPPYPG